jgi:alpha-glucoside transport system permease protein
MSNFGAIARRKHLPSQAILFILAAFWLIPTFGALITSFRTQDETLSSGWWQVLLHPFSQHWTLANYHTALTQDQMASGLTASFAITLPAMVLPIIIAAFTAYSFTYFQFKGKEFLFGIMIAFMIVPIQAALIPSINLLVWIGDHTGLKIIGNYPAGWIAHTAFAIPFATYMMRNYMASLPVELIEAAKIDGASHYRIFWRIVAPMSIPLLASYAIFQFMWVWNDYLIAYLYVGPDHPVLTYKLLNLLGVYNDGWQNVVAGSFITLFFPFLVFVTLQRFMIRGMTAGAVK